jgi:hypothetical protein
VTVVDAINDDHGPKNHLVGQGSRLSDEPVHEDDVLLQFIEVDAFSRMDGEGTPMARVPRTILDGLVACDDERSRRLFDGQRLHVTPSR